MAERRPDRTRGPEHDAFWAWCDKGELRLQGCAACSRYSWPPVKACEHCGGDQLSWKPMSGRGKVVSWCTFERDYYKGMLPIPWDTILVELEEGPLFISNPKDMTWQDLKYEMPVKVTFIDCEDKAGAFSLPIFEAI